MFITEKDFLDRLTDVVRPERFYDAGFVTGFGRSGCMAAIYASHLLNIQFVHYGQVVRDDLGRGIIIDICDDAPKAMKRAMKRYGDHDPYQIILFREEVTGLWYKEVESMALSSSVRRF